MLFATARNFFENATFFINTPLFAKEVRGQRVAFCG